MDPALISANTVARLFHGVAFKNDNTRIAASAVALSAEYIRLFVQEAVLRAHTQRLDEAAAAGSANQPQSGQFDDQFDDSFEDQFQDQFQDQSQDQFQDQFQNHQHQAGNNETDPEQNSMPVDADSDPEDRGSGVSTQLPPAESSDTLVTRHLGAVSGLLVMDF